MAELTVYGADWCPDCRRSKRLLDRLGIAYVDRDVDAEDSAANEAALISGRTSIPVIVFADGHHLVEPSDGTLTDHLRAAGLLRG